jgi:superkiller protein 3
VNLSWHLRSLKKRYENLQKSEEAIIYYQKAIDLNPDYVDAYCGLGKTYISLKKYEDAIKQINKAVKIQPDNYDSYLDLGRAYGARGSLEESINYLKKRLHSIGMTLLHGII